MKLTNIELKTIEGGAIKAGILYALGAGIIFVIGLISGYKNPYACGAGK